MAELAHELGRILANKIPLVRRVELETVHGVVRFAIQTNLLVIESHESNTKRWDELVSTVKGCYQHGFLADQTRYCVVQVSREVVHQTNLNIMNQRVDGQVAHRIPEHAGGGELGPRRHGVASNLAPGDGILATR